MAKGVTKGVAKGVAPTDWSRAPFLTEGVYPGRLADFPTNLVSVAAQTGDALVFFVRHFINVILD